MTFALRAFSYFLGALPEWCARALAAVLGGLLWHVIRYRRAVILENLTTAFPEWTERRRYQLGKEYSRHLALSLIEFFRIPRYARRNYEGVFEVRGFEHYRAAQAKGRGVLVVTGHLGSFELGAGAMARLLDGEPVWLVVKSFPRALDAFVTWVRRSTNLRIIAAKDSMPVITGALDRNETVVFVVDQNATHRLGVFVDFFGKQACTMSALAVLAARRRAPVVGAGIWREPDGRHLMQIYEEIPMERMGKARETIRHMTQVYTRFIEDRIREHPAQWLWSHRRWKTRPSA